MNECAFYIVSYRVFNVLDGCLRSFCRVMSLVTAGPRQKDASGRVTCVSVCAEAAVSPAQQGRSLRPERLEQVGVVTFSRSCVCHHLLLVTEITGILHLSIVT